MKTAISIPDALFEAVEELAERLGVSRSQVFQRAVQRFVEEHRQAGVTEALDRVYGQGGSESRVDPVLDRLQQATLVREEW